MFVELVEGRLDVLLALAELAVNLVLGSPLVGDAVVPARFAQIGECIEGGLAALRSEPAVRDVRRIGGIAAVELGGAAGGYLSDWGPRLREACRRLPHDVLLRPLGNVLYGMPPACTTDAECERIAAAMCAVVAEVTAGA